MQVNDALKSVSAFLKSLRITNEVYDPTEGVTTFSDDQLGGLTLSGKERSEYIKCLDDLVQSVFKQESFSRLGVERLLQTTILKAWNAEEGLEQIHPDRVEQAVIWLRMALRAEPKTYLVYLPVVGIDPSSLPVKVGKVTFLPGDGRTVAAVKRPVSTIIASLKNEQSNKASFAKNMRYRISNCFRNNIVAELEVHAGDDDNAQEKAVRECRRTIDAINFFSDIFASSGAKACVTLLGEGNQVIRLTRKREKTKLMIILRQRSAADESSIHFKGKQIAAFTCPESARGSITELKLPRPGSTHAIDSGLARVSELLAKDDSTTLEERILSAFQWAGRATVDVRREEAFLLYMIALESLVLGSKTNSEITDRKSVV